MSLIDDIKSVAKEDADLSKIEGQLGSYINSAELTKDNFIEVAKKHPNMLSAYDSLVSKSVESGVNNFKEKGMVDILKEKEEAIRAEISPKETPEQKKVRELTEKISAMEQKEQLAQLQDNLSAKAKELEFDPIKARDFAVWGENAIGKLEEYASWQNETLSERLNSEIKNKYKTVPPKSTSLPPADIDTRIKEARASGNTNLALKLQMLKNAKQ